MNKPLAWLVTATHAHHGDESSWVFLHEDECEDHVAWLNRPESEWEIVRVEKLIDVSRIQGQEDVARLVQLEGELREARMALEAIRARIDGEWDNEALAHFDELHTNVMEDIYYIASSPPITRRSESLRTPSGERPVIHIPDDAEYRDDGSVHWRVRVPVGAPSGEGEVTYPCRQCGTPRTAAEGGTTFTVCDECWDRQYGRPAAGEDRGYWWCPECLEEVDSSRVTYTEHHEDCGREVVWKDPLPPVNEDARTKLREELEAWIAEDRPGVVRPPFPLYLDDARTVATLLRTPSGEGEALNADEILAQLLAIRAQVDATVVMLAGGVGECPHPIDSRTDLSEMGGPERFHCHECDRIIEIDEEVDNEGA